MSPRFVLHMSLVLALAAPVAVLAQGAPARAAGEPTIDDIYKAAHGGQLTQADAMIAQVLGAHPQSAKAHFVHAELLASEGQLRQARTEYMRANELAPGLPFAKPQAVAGLLEKIDGPAASTSPSRRNLDTSTRGFAAPATTHAATDGSGMGLPAKLGLLALLLAAGTWVFRRTRAGGAPAPRAGATMATAPAYAVPSYAQGPQGMQGYGPMPAAGPAYGAAPAPTGGGGIGSALATGAAMGLGAIAVEEAVRHFTHRDGASGADVAPLRSNPPSFANDLGPDVNADLGGNDFGILDDSTWDANGAMDGGGSDGSSDW